MGLRESENSRLYHVMVIKPALLRSMPLLDRVYSDSSHRCTQKQFNIPILKTVFNPISFCRMSHAFKHEPRSWLGSKAATSQIYTA